MHAAQQAGWRNIHVFSSTNSSPLEGMGLQKKIDCIKSCLFLKGDRASQGAVGSLKETTEEGSENDHGVSSSKKMQGERGGGAALKENVCQVEI